MIDINQDLHKFQERLRSQYQLYKNKQIKYPEEDLIEKGKQYYSRLNPDEKKMYNKLNKALKEALKEMENKRKKRKLPRSLYDKS